MVMLFGHTWEIGKTVVTRVAANDAWSWRPLEHSVYVWAGYFGRIANDK